RQTDTRYQLARGRLEEHHRTLVGHPRGDLTLFFDGQDAGFALLRRRHLILGHRLQAGRLKQRHHFVEQVKEDQGDGDDYAEATGTNGDPREAVLPGASGAVALQARLVEIDIRRDKLLLTHEQKAPKLGWGYLSGGI